MKNNLAYQTGLSFVEIIIAMVVLAIGLSGIFSLMINLTKNSVLPQIEWQAIVIGDTVLKQLLNMPYRGGECSVHNTKTFESLCDYHGIKEEKVEDFLGMAKQSLTYYKISIEVQPFDEIKSIDKLALVSVKISHREFGNLLFTGLTSGTKNNEAIRIYHY